MVDHHWSDIERTATALVEQGRLTGEQVEAFIFGRPSWGNVEARMCKQLLNLPSQQHRRHIRLFVRCHLTDEQDVALRAFTAFRIWHQRKD